MHSRKLLGFLAIVLTVCFSAFANESYHRSRPIVQQDAPRPTTPHGKKLVMKDGTFQIVRDYKMEGDRVRYFSVERSEWEEMPASLIDWPATKRAESEDQKSEASFTNEVAAHEAAAKAVPLDVDASFEVVPGVFLPPGEGFFILEGKAVFQLKQSAASTKLNKHHLVEQVVVPIPVIPSRSSVDLPGRHATFRTTSSEPEFYFRTKDSSEPEIELLEAHIHGDKRHIENIDSLFGQDNHKGKTVLMQEWQVATGLYRFTLGQSLAPGEYALAQFSPKEGINLLLWDFGVDAPAKQAAGKK